MADSPNDTRVIIAGAVTDPDQLRFRKYRKTALAEAVRIEAPFKVETLEGIFEAKAGDYLMRGPAGELYSCAAAIFESTYEEAADAEEVG